MGMIARLYDDERERSKIMGYVLGGIATGVLIGYPFGGVLYDFAGKTAPFVIISVVCVLVLGAMIVSILPLAGEEAEDATERAEYDGGSAKISFTAFLKDPYILVVTGAVWFSTTAMAMLEPCLPIWLMNTIHPEVRRKIFTDYHNQMIYVF